MDITTLYNNPAIPVSKPNIKVNVNEDVYVSYSHFKNNFTFERPGALSWFSQQAKPWQEPVDNCFVQTVRNAGVNFLLFEHVSVVLSGNIEYKFTTADGSVFDFSDCEGCELGSCNVDNNLGYVPADTWWRTFSDDCRTACILFNPDRDTSREYRFQVIKNISELQTSRDFEFLHVCSGSVLYDNQTYNSQQNLFSIPNNSELSLAENTVLIAGWTI